ncbi:hypothetical protein CGZ94_15130 [Enemella evansiae]|uniref:Oxalate:formate antiporter n=1 Tax=Enemella evansiae TaxID=2016499 RepID=A0A255G868_9ACTN|nr:hypothetical protein [Enemella evansiae]OYO11741.1 hypothetical protein CGZ94_15130 [Enemella evansiae]
MSEHDQTAGGVRPTPAFLVLLAWLAVGIPLAYGLWQTLLKASALFLG